MENVITVHLPQRLFEQTSRMAKSHQQSVENFVVNLIAESVMPSHPYIEMAESRSGNRPILRGTRVGVDVVVGYYQAGHTAEEIAQDILPHLSQAQVYAALSYYADHQEQMDAEMAQHTPEAWQARLVQSLGAETAVALLGN